MPKNPKISQLDPSHIASRTFDEDHDAVRMMLPHDQQMELSLSAEDGDSVQDLPRLSLFEGREVSIEACRKVAIYACSRAEEGTAPAPVYLFVSPAREGDLWFRCGYMEVAPGAADLMPPRDVCGARLKVVAPDELEIKIVGQS